MDYRSSTGYHFIINVEKSRFVREKSKIPISVSWDGGIQKWSGLLDVALESGHVRKPKNGWYQAVVPETGEELTQNLRHVQTMNQEFWQNVFEKTDFESYIEKRFKIATKNILQEGVTEK